MTASFPVKCHLPLITSRIEFQFNALPTPPQITPRRDLGAHIRRQNRRDSISPYSTSRHFRGVTPARSQSGRSDTPPSHLSSDDEKGSEKIPKPHGEVGRVNGGGYDLQTALGWEYEQFNKFCKYINEEAAETLDIKKRYSKQSRDDLDLIIQLTTRKFGLQNKYSNDWPVRDVLKMRLKYTADCEKKKERRLESDITQALKRQNQNR